MLSSEPASSCESRTSSRAAYAAEDFPLSQAEIDLLLVDLQRRVRSIEAAEHEALGALRVAAATMDVAGGR